MPALPTGLSSSRKKVLAHAVHTLDDTVSGTSGRQHIQPMSTVSRPVGIRWIRLGATIAPRIPPTPAAVETRPICAAGTPSGTIRSTTTKKIALVTRLVSDAHDHQGAEERPRPHEAEALGELLAQRLAPAVRRAEVGAHPAHGHAGDREGERVDRERQPAGDGVQRTAERAAEQRGDVLAGLVLAERGRQVVGRDDRPDRRDLGRVEGAGGDAADERDADEVGKGEGAERRRRPRARCTPRSRSRWRRA